jgi:phosphoenolpyruvate carboxykinase (GTP)
MTPEGDVWWEGMTDELPERLTDWRGEDWTPETGTPAAHPNARFTTPASQCPSIAPEWQDPAGVPISAILFGGRRATNVPLVTEARDWDHGVFLGSIMSSEKTAAAAGTIGQVRFDPFAMLPFMGYNVGDYFSHWLSIGDRAEASRLPKLFWVNWFRKDADGNFMWPGFGDNIRVLKWVVERVAGTGAATDTPIGLVPTIDAIDRHGTDVDDQTMAQLLAVGASSWDHEVALINEHYSMIGDRLPKRLDAELDDLSRRLDEA